MKFGVYNEIIHFLMYHTSVRSLWTLQKHLVSHAHLQYLKHLNIMNRDEKIVFSVEYCLI